MSASNQPTKPESKRAKSHRLVRLIRYLLPVAITLVLFAYLF